MVVGVAVARCCQVVASIVWVAARAVTRCLLKQNTLICKQREIQVQKTLISSWRGIAETEKPIITRRRGIKKWKNSFRAAQTPLD
jgi:hypothetical protein